MMPSNFALRFERSTPLLWAVVLGFAPWVLAPMACGRWGVAVSIVFISSYLSGLGFITLFYFGFFEDRPSLRAAFAPGIGVIIGSGLLFLAVRFGFNGFFLYWTTCMIGWLGAVLLVKSVRQTSPSALNVKLIQYLVLVSTLVCLSYFVTDIRKNHVATPENGYSFLHMDSTYNMTIAAAIKNGVQPWTPTFGNVPLVYHYGSQSIGGSYARFTGTNLSDGLVALAGTGLMALLSASVGLAALVTRIYGGDPILGPVAGGIGVIFFNNATEILRTTFRFIVVMLGFTVSEIGDLSFGTGSTNHFHTGQSTLWGSSGLIVIMGLTLWRWEKKRVLSWQRSSALLCLSALVCFLNVFAGIAVSGTLATVAVIQEIKNWKSWLFAVAISGLAIGSYFIMVTAGNLQFDAQSTLTLLRNPIGKLFALAAERSASIFWIFLGFGVALVPMGILLSQPWHLVALLSLVLATGGFVFSTFVDMDLYSNDRYFLRFFYHFSVVCSMAILSGAFREWLRGRGTNAFAEHTVGVYGIISLVSSLFLSIQIWAWAVSMTGTHPFHDGIVRILAPFLTAIISYWLWNNVRWTTSARSICMIILTCLIMAQIAGSLRSIYIYAIKMPVVSNNRLLVLDANELKGLYRLRSISKPTDLCATNRYLGDHYPKDMEKLGALFQVLYTPLAERRFLIETPLPYAKIGSDEVRSDNRLMFEGTDIQTIRNVINKHKIRYLVCEPVTDLAVAKNLPLWLYKIPDTGSLKIYQVHD